jgi:hypothetical protein
MEKIHQGSLINRLLGRDRFHKMIWEKGFDYRAPRNAGLVGRRSHPFPMSLWCKVLGHDWYPEYCTSGIRYDAQRSGCRCIWCGKVWDTDGQPLGWTPKTDILSKVERARMLVSANRGNFSDEQFHKLFGLVRTNPQEVLALFAKQS